MTLAEVFPYKEQFLANLQDPNKIEEIKRILSLAEKELIKKGVQSNDAEDKDNGE